MEKTLLKANSCSVKMRSFFDRVAASCTENPLKVYAAIYLLGDVVLGTNPNGHWLWQAGALISVLANANKVVFGKGGEAVDLSTFQITKEGLKQTGREALLSPLRLFTWDCVQDIGRSIAQVKLKDLVVKAKRARKFWKYPLDAGWMLYMGTGTSYALDAFLLDPTVRGSDAFIGCCGAAASAFGFATDNNKVVGRVFGLMSMFLLVEGIRTANPSLAGASFVYLYGNHAMGQAISARQSSYTVRQHQAVSEHGLT